MAYKLMTMLGGYVGAGQLASQPTAILACRHRQWLLITHLSLLFTCRNGSRFCSRPPFFYTLSPALVGATDSFYNELSATTSLIKLTSKYDNEYARPP